MARTAHSISLPYQNETGACPCFGCAERSEGCHSVCQRFMQWDSIAKTVKEKRRKGFFQSKQAEYRRKEAVAAYKRRKG